MDIYKRLKQLNINLSTPSPTSGVYAPFIQFGSNLVYVSGQNCKKGDLVEYPGRLGKEVTIAQGQLSAKQCGINLLSNLNHHLGDLNQIKRIIKVLGFVASTPSFHKQSEVINGFSQLFVDVFGEDVALAARTAIGVPSLPNNICVEIELLLELKTSLNEN